MLQVRIEKLVYGGAGLGRLDGRAVLLPLVLPGELVTAQPVKEEPRLVHARLTEVLEASPGRIAAGCPYFTRCGGCHYQHTGHEEQLGHKAAILRETLLRISKLAAPDPEVISSPPWNYRNRVQLKSEKDDDGFRLGYFEMGSHRLLPVERCPISSPRINELIPEIWELGKRPDFPSGTGEIEVFVDHDDIRVLLNVAGSEPWPETLVSAARERISGLVSLAVSEGQGRRARVFTSSGAHGYLIYRAGGLDYRVSHGSFFQTNRFLADRFAQEATAGLAGDTALELFSGVGYFTLRLASGFRRVAAVESNPSSIRDLESNRNRAGIGNIDVRHASAEEFLAKWSPRRQARPDAVLLDPPRSGLGKKAAEQLAGLGAPTIVYVSCDPATLARDLAGFTSRGYRLSRLRLVDLFPQTFHIEAVATLEKS